MKILGMFGFLPGALSQLISRISKQYSLALQATNGLKFENTQERNQVRCQLGVIRLSKERKL